MDAIDSKTFDLGPLFMIFSRVGYYLSFSSFLGRGVFSLVMQLGIGFPKQYSVHDLSLKLMRLSKNFSEVGVILDLFGLRLEATVGHLRR